MVSHSIVAAAGFNRLISFSGLCGERMRYEVLVSNPRTWMLDYKKKSNKAVQRCGGSV